MLFDKTLALPGLDAGRAEEDSLTLWRELRYAIAKSRPKDASDRSADSVDTIPFSLTGRYRVGDGSEYPGEITGISPFGIHLRGPMSAAPGKWCTAHIESVGIAEGVVVRSHFETFTVGVIAPFRRLRRLAERLSWQLQHEKGEVAERRSSERIEMNHAKATLATSDGQSFSCDIFDMSTGGAALHLGSDALYFWVDQPIKLDERCGRVLRHFPGGIVVTFD